MVIEYLQRKNFEQIVNCLPEDFTTNDLSGILITCMRFNMIVPNVVNVEKISYDKLALRLVDGENVAYEIPAWYWHWPRKIMLGNPENHVFTLQEIQKEISEINEIESGMHDDLRQGTKIENLAKYCEMHAGEELPWWMYSGPPNIDYLLQVMWGAADLGGAPKSIVTTEWICLDDDPYFAEIRLPAWFSVFFERLDTFYLNSGVESPTWGHVSTLINW